MGNRPILWHIMYIFPYSQHGSKKFLPLVKTGTFDASSFISQNEINQCEPNRQPTVRTLASVQHAQGHLMVS